MCFEKTLYNLHKNTQLIKRNIINVDFLVLVNDIVKLILFKPQKH